MTRKGFLLADALLCMVILAALCLLSLSMAKVMERGKEGEKSHLIRTEERLKGIYASIPDCTGCILS